MLKEMLSFITELKEVLRDLKNAYISVFKTNPVQANLSLSLIVSLAITLNLFYFEINKKEVQVIYFDNCQKKEASK